jgi:hypothetical protein
MSDHFEVAISNGTNGLEKHITITPNRLPTELPEAVALNRAVDALYSAALAFETAWKASAQNPVQNPEQILEQKSTQQAPTQNPVQNPEQKSTQIPIQAPAQIPTPVPVQPPTPPSYTLEQLGKAGAKLLSSLPEAEIKPKLEALFKGLGVTRLSELSSDKYAELAEGLKALGAVL